MNLKTTKIITVLIYLLITFDTGHVGGQFGTFLILGLISGGLNFFLSLIILSIIVLQTRSAFKPFKNEFLFFLGGGMVMLIPIITHLVFLISKKHSIDFSFYLITLLFLLFYSLTLYKIKKQKKNTQ